MNGYIILSFGFLSVLFCEDYIQGMLQSIRMAFFSSQRVGFIFIRFIWEHVRGNRPYVLTNKGFQTLPLFSFPLMDFALRFELLLVRRRGSAASRFTTLLCPG